jgi:hypothetical protein
MMTPQMAEFDIKQTITLLGGEDASYVGIAKLYRAELEQKGLLTRNIDKKDNIPVAIYAFAAATADGIFWNHNVLGTTLTQVETIVGELNDAGVKNVDLTYLYWSRAMTTGRERDALRFKRNIGSLSGFGELGTRIEAAGNKLSLHLNYDYVYGRRAGLNMREDIIRGINRSYLRGSFTTGAVRYNYSIVNSSGFEKLFSNDIQIMKQNDIGRLHIDMPWASSSFNRQTVWREQTIKNLAETLKNHVSEPMIIDRGSFVPEYLPFTRALSSTNMVTSLYPYVTDTIPLTPLILRGYVDMYAESYNTSGSPNELLLKMIEWGVYPAFDITWTRSSEFEYTNAWYLVATTFSQWKSEIINVFETVNYALRDTIGERISNHVVLAPGVVRVTYENGVQIYVNYTDVQVEFDGVVIAAEDFEVKRR